MNIQGIREKNQLSFWSLESFFFMLIKNMLSMGDRPQWVNGILQEHFPVSQGSASFARPFPTGH